MWPFSVVIPLLFLWGNPAVANSFIEMAQDYENTVAQTTRYSPAMEMPLPALLWDKDGSARKKREQWYEKITGTFSAIDSITLKREVVFIKESRRHLDELHNKLKGKDQQKITKLIKRLDQSQEKWHQGINAFLSDELSPDIAQKMQMKRMHGFSDYTQHLKEIYAALGHKVIANHSGFHFSPLAFLIKAYGLGVATTCCLAITNFPGGYTTVPNRINTMFEGFRKFNGYRIFFDNTEKAVNFDFFVHDTPPPYQNRRVLNLILPTHKRAVEDAYMIAAMGIKKYLLFANPNSVAPHMMGLAKTGAHTKSIIPVGPVRKNPTSKKLTHLTTNLLAAYKKGHLTRPEVKEIKKIYQLNLFSYFGKRFTGTGNVYSYEDIVRIQDTLKAKANPELDDVIKDLDELKGEDTMETLINDLQRTDTHNIINYAQGFVSDKNETLPLHPAFSEKMIRRLISEGYAIRVLPISYLEESAFLNVEDNKKMELIFHTPISPREMDQLMALEVKDEKLYFNQYIRALWYKTQADSETSRYHELNLVDIFKRYHQVISLTDDELELLNL